MDVRELVDSCGFDAVGSCSASELSCRDEVRDMCAADRCRHYGRSWACPPACGDLEHFQKLISSRKTCLVVQSFGELEDPFDLDAMLELEKVHKGRFGRLNDLLRDRNADILMLSAGSCSVCGECTYPDAPCRFPDKSLVSMEAAGLVVSDVCLAAGIPYNHGENTISFTSCVLV